MAGMIAMVIFWAVIYIIRSLFDSGHYAAGWTVIGLIVGGIITLVAIGATVEAIGKARDRRAATETVDRLLALEPLSSWTEWQVPAPESFALVFGPQSLKADSVKLALLQLIAMGVLETGTSIEGSGSTLRAGPNTDFELTGSVARVHAMWEECTVQQTQQSYDGPQATTWRARSPAPVPEDAHAEPSRVRYWEGTPEGDVRVTGNPPSEHSSLRQRSPAPGGASALEINSRVHRNQGPG